MGYRIVRKPSKAYIVRSGADYYAESDTSLSNSLGTTEQDYYAVLENSVYGKILINSVNYLVATADLEMIGDTSDYNQVQSADDIVPMRYAYGNQNGYAIGIGSELNNPTYASNVFTVHSGKVVVQGVEIDIDANGMSTTIDTANETRYYKVYLEVNFNENLNLYNATLKNSYSTVGYDEITIPTSTELLNGGVAYLGLYQLKLNGSTQEEILKTVKKIGYSGMRLVWEGEYTIGRDYINYNPFASFNLQRGESATYQIEIEFTTAGEYKSQYFINTTIENLQQRNTRIVTENIFPVFGQFILIDLRCSCIDDIVDMDIYKTAISIVNNNTYADNGNDGSTCKVKRIYQIA